jgi:hypothetical protein
MFARCGHRFLGTEGFVGGSRRCGGGRWRAQRDCAEAKGVQRALRHDEGVCAISDEDNRGGNTQMKPEKSITFLVMG